MGSFSVILCCVVGEVWDYCPRKCGTELLGQLEEQSLPNTVLHWLGEEGLSTN